MKKKANIIPTNTVLTFLMDVLPPQVMFKSDFENAKIMREDGCTNY